MARGLAQLYKHSAKIFAIIFPQGGGVGGLLFIDRMKIIAILDQCLALSLKRSVSDV